MCFSKEVYDSESFTNTLELRLIGIKYVRFSKKNSNKERGKVVTQIYSKKKVFNQ